MQVNKIRQKSKQNVKALFDIIIKEIVEKAFDKDVIDPDDYLISTHFAFRENFSLVF